MFYNTMNIKQGAFHQFLIVFLCATLFLASAVSQAKDTPFGVGLSLAHAPNSTGQDLQSGLAISSVVGGHMSVVWSWNKQGSISFHDNVIPIAKQFGLKILFQISPTAVGNPTPPLNLPASFSDPDTRAKYLEDVQHFAGLQPDYINLCAEVNLMYEFNNPEFQNYVSLYQEAYNLVKSISPNTQIGVSLLDILFIGYRQFSIINELGTVDFVGITTYPAKMLKEGTLGAVSNLSEFPRGWYDIVRTVFPNTPIIYTEVGWSSEEISNEQEQAAFVAALPWLFEGVQPELVTWTLLHSTRKFQTAGLDEATLAFLESLGVDPVELFNRFNGMGLFDWDGFAKPAWDEAIDLDFDNPITPDFDLIPLP